MARAVSVPYTNPPFEKNDRSSIPRSSPRALNKRVPDLWDVAIKTRDNPSDSSHSSTKFDRSDPLT
jgi:hypothetical protein